VLGRLTVIALALALLPACRGTGFDSSSRRAKPATARSTRIRQPVDKVGYTHAAAGIEKVVAHAARLEAGQLAGRQLGTFSGAISPHDDYQYAQRVYVHLYPHVAAKDVVLIGVAHKARRFPETEGKLVFDGFDAWRGPYGPVSISPLRQELLAGLRRRAGRDAVVVNDELQAMEHSVEAMVPFLQHRRRDVRIVSILVPYVSWDRLARLARAAADVLARTMRARKLALGRDVAILISADLVHYGDQGWGGKSHADFGVDRKGYERAVARDREMIDQHLSGPIALERLGDLYHKLVQEDFHEYRITWCGRFSIPFGLALLKQTAVQLGRPRPGGVLLRYGTTLDPGRSDPGVAGLGVTGPAHLRHWVSFAAVGYR
jgi:AmmeMemoRadiSam system protein B